VGDILGESIQSNVVLELGRAGMTARGGPQTPKKKGRLRSGLISLLRTVPHCGRGETTPSCRLAQHFVDGGKKERRKSRLISHKTTSL